MLLSSGPDAEDFQSDGHDGLKPGCLAAFDLSASRFESLTKVDRVVGTMMPVGTDHVVSFFEHPKLINRHSGEATAAWPDIVSGKQNSSIIWQHDDPLPPIALDPNRWRFAVAERERITVF